MKGTIVEDSMISELEKIVGKTNVSNNYSSISQYCLNHVAQNIFPAAGDFQYVVVQPRTIDQVVSVIKYASASHVQVFVRGGGTGYNGGCIPTNSGIVVELSNLNRIIQVDSENGYVTCEAGITVLQLNRYLQSTYGLWWTHDPGSREWATVGGTLSTMGGGAFMTKYGSAPDTLISMKVVTPDGDLVELGRTKSRHDMLTYNLLDLMTSSEGTLGIIVAVTLKVYPIPKTRKITLALFDKFEDAQSACFDSFNSGLYAESIMLEDRLRFTLESLGPLIESEGLEIESLGLEKIESVAIFSFTGKTEIVREQTRLNNNILEAHGGKIVNDDRIVRAYWKSKTELPSWSKDVGRLRVHSFVPTVPLINAVQIHKTYYELASSLGLNMIGARYYVMLPLLETMASPSIMFDDTDPESVAKYDEFTNRFAARVLEIGGTPASTLGVGMHLTRVVDRAVDSQTVQFMKQIKRCFDPAGLLNSGKKFSVVK